MNLLLILGDVWQIFRSDRARFLLTLSGIVIGVASLVMLSGLLQGGQEALKLASQQATEDQLIKVRPAEVPEKQRNRTTRPLERSDRDVLAETASLHGAPVETEQQIHTEAYYRKARQWVTVVGAAPSTQALYELKVEKGRFLSELDVLAGARVAVVGRKVYEDLLGSPATLDGLNVTAQGERFAVVGVLKHQASLGGNQGPWTWDGRLLVPHSAFAAAYRAGRNVDRLFVRLALTEGLGPKLAEARGIVRETVKRRHYGVKNFQIEGEGEQAAKEELIMSIIQMLMLTTAVLSLVVGGINIMNIMLVSVTERTREIGIRRALGAARRTVLVQFLAESAVVAALGGLIGVVAGLVVTRTAAAALSLWLGQWKFHVVGWALASGLGAAAAVGILFGLYPAWRAARLDPSEALRFE